MSCMSLTDASAQETRRLQDVPAEVDKQNAQEEDALATCTAKTEQTATKLASVKVCCSLSTHQASARASV